MKMYWGVDVVVNGLTSALDGGKWSTSPPGPVRNGEETGWVLVSVWTR